MQRHNKGIIPITPLLVLFFISILTQRQQATINQSCIIFDWGSLYRFRAYMPPLKPGPKQPTLPQPRQEHSLSFRNAFQSPRLSEFRHTAKSTLGLHTMACQHHEGVLIQIPFSCSSSDTNTKVEFLPSPLTHPHLIFRPNQVQLGVRRRNRVQSRDQDNNQGDSNSCHFHQ